MTISATCPKGHTLTLEEKLAGKKIRCPRCQVVFEVPGLEAEEVEEAEAVSEKPMRKASRRRDDDDDDEDDRPRGRGRGRSRDDDDDEDDERPRRSSRRAAAADDDDDDEPMDDETRRKLERRLKKKQLKLVDVGLLLHYIKLWMYAIGMAIGIAVLIMFVIAAAGTAELQAEAAAKKGAEKINPIVPGGGFVLFGIGIFALLLFMMQLFVWLIGPLIGIVGSFLCCWVPKKSQARGTIIMSLTFDLIAIVGWLLGVLAVANVFGMEENKRDNFLMLLRGINGFCGIAAWLTFLTFLRGFGAYLGEPSLGNEALNLIARLVVQVITLFVNIATNIFIVVIVGYVLAIIIAIGTTLLWIPFFIFTFYLRLIKLIGGMRMAVQNKL